jgi:deferrochelatase/peroxidase EfeB
MHGRRNLLLGLVGAAAGFGARAASLPDDLPRSEEDDSTLMRQPFYGPHQAGVVTPQPAAALWAAFDVLAASRAELSRLFGILTERGAFLTQGGPVAGIDPKLPPLDSGVLGPAVFADDLTMTVAVGASLFDQRYGLAGRRPRRLIRMQGFPNDALEASLCHGDLLLQFCSNTAETNIHALRDIVKRTPDLLSLRWRLAGFLPAHTIKRQGRDTVRNLMGFKDGTANLDPRDAALMQRIVWVQPDSGEPGWSAGGTYQVVRIIRMKVEHWDRTPLGEQQAIMGRDKTEGAPLGMRHERDLPDYASDQKGDVIPLDAHIRLANPRTEETAGSRILRRGYNYDRGVTKSGQMDMGLLFVCFQADLSAGFVAIQQRLNGEPLEEYVKPVGGGYFFVLPGVKDRTSILGEGLLAA